MICAWGEGIRATLRSKDPINVSFEEVSDGLFSSDRVGKLVYYPD